MKTIVFLLILVLVSHSIAAEDDSVSSSELVLQISSLPEAKLGFIQRFQFPFLQGSGPLTENNNIKLNLTGEVSPVSLNLIGEAVWTPIAFIEIAAGGRIGSGWPLNLFGSYIYGIGFNQADENGNAEYNGSGFDGLLWKAQVGGVFQFDLAAIFPGEWNHVVFRTYHEINYKGYTRAKGNESWYFEADEGENMNGFNYYGNFLLGYQMPIFLNLVGILAEMELYLYDTPNRHIWGDDRIRWMFACILNFKIIRQFDIALLAQFRTRRNYAESDWENLYYRNRTLNTSNPQRLEFYRVAAIAAYRF